MGRQLGGTGLRSRDLPRGRRSGTESGPEQGGVLLHKLDRKSVV